MNQNNKYAVETFSLSKVFTDLWGRNRVYAVNDLNLRVRYNEVFGLLGPNGSGKTTTIKVLLGLLHPTKGKSLVLGGDATDPKINARIGFLPEESYLYRYLTARETLDFEYVPLEELLKKSDVISVHAPYNKHTHHMINSTNIRQIKHGAVLVNTARGAIVELNALKQALDEGILSGAALDVIEGEELLLKDRNQLTQRRRAASKRWNRSQSRKIGC